MVYAIKRQPDPVFDLTCISAKEAAALMRLLSLLKCSTSPLDDIHTRLAAVWSHDMLLPDIRYKGQVYNNIHGYVIGNLVSVWPRKDES